MFERSFTIYLSLLRCYSEVITRPLIDFLVGVCWQLDTNISFLKLSVVTYSLFLYFFPSLSSDLGKGQAGAGGVAAGRLLQVFFFFLIHYSHATCGDHGEVMYSPFPVRCPRSGGSLQAPLFALRPGLSHEKG